MINKYRIIKIVTSSNAFLWHISSTLDHLSDKYEIYIIGNDLEKYKNQFKDVRFININIKRKPAPFRDLVSLICLIYYFIKIKPMLVHSIMPKSGLLTAISGFIARVPIRLHTFTGQVWYTRKGFSRYILKSLDKLIIMLNTECLADSLSQAKYIDSEVMKNRGKELKVINHGSICGINLDQVTKVLQGINSSKLQDIRDKYNINKSDFVFCYMARKTKDKGAIDIIDAFNRVKKQAKNKLIKLLYIGPYEENINLSLRQAFSFNQIIDIGLVKNPLDYLSISNVFCLPSYREGFGNVIIDAAALGIPSIGYDIIGLKDSIVNEKTGITCPVGNIEMFSKLMLKIMVDDKFRIKLANQSKINAHENFNAKDLSQGYEKFYNHLIKSVI